MSERVARSRELVARGFRVATVARVMRISRQALYRTPTPRRPPQRRPPADAVEAAIVEEALANQTDGYRMITAFVRRRLSLAVNRKRVHRVMRERKLIQRRRPLERRKRPGFFRVERPRQLWQLDLTSIWVAEHGWTLWGPKTQIRVVGPRGQRRGAAAKAAASIASQTRRRLRIRADSGGA